MKGEEVICAAQICAHKGIYQLARRALQRVLAQHCAVEETELDNAKALQRVQGAYYSACNGCSTGGYHAVEAHNMSKYAFGIYVFSKVVLKPVQCKV